MGLFEILSHDILQSSPIFDFDLPDKAQIEQHLRQNSWSSVNNLKTHVILDFMSKLRQMQTVVHGHIRCAYFFVRMSITF